MPQSSIFATIGAEICLKNSLLMLGFDPAWSIRRCPMRDRCRF